MVGLLDWEVVWTAIRGSLANIILIAIILLTTVVVSRAVNQFLYSYFHRAKKSQIVKVDETSYAFLKHFITGIIYVLGISVAIYMIPPLRTLSISLFAGAGILAVIVGFASQAAFSNIVSGIFISIFKPFRVGDRIKLQSGLFGKVEDITLRHTVIKTFENNRHIIPNSKISEQDIENLDMGEPDVKQFIEYGISYDSDINKAIRIIREEIMKHPDFTDKRTEEEKVAYEPAVSVKVVAWADHGVVLRASAWSKDSAAAWRLKTDTLKSIKERFDKEGIEIPYPHRVVLMKDMTRKSAGKTKRRTKRKRR